MSLPALQSYAEIFATCLELRAENERLRDVVRAQVGKAIVEYTATVEYTEGACGDGAVILANGLPVPIGDVLAALNDRERLREGIRAVIEGDEPRATCIRCGESCACVHAFLGKLLEG